MKTEYLFIIVKLILLSLGACLQYGTLRAQIKPGTVQYQLGSTTITFRTTCFGAPSKIVFVNLHENENSSVLSAAAILDSVHQHCMVELQLNKKRLIDFRYKGKNYIIDPNRIFTDRGVKATLKRNNKDYTEEVIKSVKQMAQRYTSSYINDRQIVIALHNNSNVGYSVLSYAPGSEYAGDAADVWISRQEDPDDFFYTNQRSYFELFKSKNYNAVLQNNRIVTDDGSLSVYCAAKNISYINIEAEAGNISKQKEMLGIVLATIAKKQH